MKMKTQHIKICGAHSNLQEINSSKCSHEEKKRVLKINILNFQLKKLKKELSQNKQRKKKKDKSKNQ